MFGKFVKKMFDKGKKEMGKGLAKLDSEAMADVGLDIEKDKLEDAVSKLVKSKAQLRTEEASLEQLQNSHNQKVVAAQQLMKTEGSEEKVNTLLKSMESSKKKLEAMKTKVGEHKKTVQVLEGLVAKRKANFESLKNRLDNAKSAMEVSELKRQMAEERAALQNEGMDDDSSFNAAIAAMEGVVADNTAAEETADIISGKDDTDDVDAILAEVSATSTSSESAEDRLARLM